MESTNADDADLELLLRPASAGIPKPLTTEDVVSLFVESQDLMPGRARSIPARTMYRCYLDWHAKALPDRPPLGAVTFPQRMGDLGFKARTPRGSTRDRPYGLELAGAVRMRKWAKDNPEPYGWRVQWAEFFHPPQPSQGEGS